MRISHLKISIHNPTNHNLIIVISVLYIVCDLFIVNCNFGVLINSSMAYAQDDIRDIKPPVDLPPDYFLLYFILAVLLLGGIFVLVRVFLPRLKQPKRKSIPLKSPWDVACERLKALQKQNLPQQGQIKEYYTQLSDIVRQYIEDRFRIRAPEMTTPEFLLYLRDSQALTTEHKGFLKDFLNSCDMVKFAKYGPSLQETDESFRLAVKLVDETKGDS